MTESHAAYSIQPKHQEQKKNIRVHDCTDNDVYEPAHTPPLE